MGDSGLRPAQVVQVRGFADQQLRKPEDPTNATNRRISVIVQYLPVPPSVPQVAKLASKNALPASAKPGH
jgi:chemotaxis protein MotB